ncbi:MAG TPA: hypothetical protein PLK97_03380 [Pseudomonadales bacterium]|nr:hypothetical protein [Pseudomonadales bacterium]HNL23616.1 hypothetical protein [Pseudomonadales bacterium]HNL31103.1 hypothetical protein [Pseudomonadales bacterium]
MASVGSDMTDGPLNEETQQGFSNDHAMRRISVFVFLFHHVAQMAPFRRPTNVVIVAFATVAAVDDAGALRKLSGPAPLHCGEVVTEGEPHEDRAGPVCGTTWNLALP